MLPVNLLDDNSIHLQSNKFVTGVKTVARVHSKPEAYHLGDMLLLKTI